MPLTDQYYDGKRRDLLVCGFWEYGTDFIAVVCFMDMDAMSYKNKTPAKVLEINKKEKKTKYLQAGKEQQIHFILFGLSAYSLLWKEADTFLTRLAIKLAYK